MDPFSFASSDQLNLPLTVKVYVTSSTATSVDQVLT